jgi:hypothetical protein
MEDLGSSHGLALRREVFVAGLFGGQSMGIERRFGMFDQFLDLFEFQLVFQKNGSLLLELVR